MYSFAHFCCITIAINQSKSIRVLELWMLLEKYVTKIKTELDQINNTYMQLNIYRLGKLTTYASIKYLENIINL